MDRRRIGLREVRALAPFQEIWDAAVPGFGARRQKGAAVSYVLMYRTREGRQRRFTIGRHGAWTPDTAREEARRLLGEVVRGADPAADKREAREAMTVAELCDAYLADAQAGRLLTRRGQSKKASTLAIDRGRIERHFKPLLGNRAVAAGDTSRYRAFHACCRRRQVRGARQDEAAWAGAGPRRPWHGDPSRGVARGDLHLRGAEGVAGGQPGRRRDPLRRRKARAAAKR